MRSWNTRNGYKITQILSVRSNVFLLSNNQSNILIDTGPEFMWKTLQKRLDQLEINKINLLILTHSHFDHSANAKKIKEKYKAKVIIHKNESDYLLYGDNILPQGTNPFSETLVRLFTKQFISLAKYEPCNFDISVDRSFSLDRFGFNALLIHTPGHTPGSMSLIIDNEVALVGDTMFGVFWWTVFPPFANNTIQLLESWGNLLKTKCKIFIPSHGSANSRFLVEKDFKRRNSANT